MKKILIYLIIVVGLVSCTDPSAQLADIPNEVNSQMVIADGDDIMFTYLIKTDNAHYLYDSNKILLYKYKTNPNNISINIFAFIIIILLSFCFGLIIGVD